MIYNLSYSGDRTRFEKQVEKLLKADATVELTEKKQRSLQQNKYLHLILGWFALEYGCSLEEVKVDFFKRLVNKNIFERPNPKRLGVCLRSTADLTKEEMILAVERFRNWSSMEASIYLPSPNEDEFLKHIQREISRSEFI